MRVGSPEWVTGLQSTGQPGRNTFPPPIELFPPPIELRSFSGARSSTITISSISSDVISERISRMMALFLAQSLASKKTDNSISSDYTEIAESWGNNIEDARFAEINGETTGRHQHVIHKSGTRTRTSHDEYRHPASSGNAPGHSILHSSARAGAIIGVRRPASGRREAQAVLSPGWVRMQEDRK